MDTPPSLSVADALQMVIDFGRTAIAAGVVEPNEVRQFRQALDVLEDLAVNQYADD